MNFDWMTVENLQEAFTLLINNEFLSDVKFRFPNKNIIFAHSFILSLRCQEFYENFQGTIGVKKLIEVDTDVTHASFMDFLKYLYTNEIIINENNVGDLSKLSIKYKVDKLSKRCREHVMCNVTNETACNVLECAINEKLDQLQKVTQEFISNDYLNVLKTKSFPEIKENTLKSILELDPVSDTNEYYIFNEVVKWTSRACEKDGVNPTGDIRRAKLAENIKLIRFASMTLEEFSNCPIIAPDLLTSDEIASVFIDIGTKTPNKYGFSNRARNKKQSSSKNDTLVLNTGIKFNWIRYDRLDLDTFTFNFGFKDQKLIILHGIALCITTQNVWIEYKLFKDEKSFQVGVSRSYKIDDKEQGIKIDPPIEIQPGHNYKFEYILIKPNDRRANNCIQTYTHPIPSKITKVLFEKLRSWIEFQTKEN